MIELNTITDPSSFIGVNGIDYELWAYGWDPFITETKVSCGRTAGTRSSPRPR